MSTPETAATADTTTAQAAVEQEKPKAKTKRVRVLCDTNVEGKTYKVDQVVEFDTVRVASLEKAGAVDGNPAAVAYALSQGAKPVIHKPSDE